MHIQPSGTGSLTPTEVLVANSLNSLSTQIHELYLREPTDELKRAIVNLTTRVLSEGIPTVPPPPTQEDAGANYIAKLTEYQNALWRIQDWRPEYIAQSLNESILTFLKALPNPEHMLWYAPACDIIPVGQTIAKIGTLYFFDSHFCKTIHDKYLMGARQAGELQGKKDHKGELIYVWPEKYDEPDILQRYLIPEFQHLFQCKVPYGYEDETRLWHQWIMAPSGTGKTTLLSAHIKADLERVARDECSILVMDSAERLVPDIAMLKCFAPGQPMHDRLIYIEPSVVYPPALNMFHRPPGFDQLDPDDRFRLKMATMEIMEFFFSSALKLTEKQETAFHRVLSAVMEVPNATIFTLRDMLKDDGWTNHRDQLLDRLDDHTIDWFEEHCKPHVKGQPRDIYAETRQEISHRVDSIDKNELFRKMFSHPERKLNLFSELSKGKVILINSKQAMLRNTLEPWGRLFIMLLLQAIEERLAVGRTKNIPCFCYIDEAGDYIAREPNLKKIYRLARKQRVGLTLAHHDEQDIEEAKVFAALEGSGIKVRPAKGFKYGFHFEVRDNSPITMRVPPVDFSHEDAMSPEEWDVVLAEQRARFCVDFSKPTRASTRVRPTGTQFVDSHDED